MPVQVIAAAAAPDEPPRPTEIDLLDDVAIERAVRALLDEELYGTEHAAELFRLPVPELTVPERREAARRLRAARDQRNVRRFACSKAADARRRVQP